MDFSSPPSFPSSFDPAVHLHSEANDPLPAIVHPSSEADRLEAIQLQREEAAAQKSRQGIVIQHRAWKLKDVFRSEDDYLPDTPIKKRLRLDNPLPFLSSSLDTPPPSSPRQANMALISSPVAFPPSSSPPPQHHRHVTQDKRPSTQTTTAPKTMAGFIIDDEDDEDGFEALKEMETTDVSRPKDQELQHKLHDHPTQITPPSEPARPAPFGRFEQRRDAHKPQTTPSFLPKLPSLSSRTTIPIRTCSGKTYTTFRKAATNPTSFQDMAAARSTTAPGRAKKSYYGIDVHRLIDENTEEDKRSAQESAAAENSSARPSVETSLPQPSTDKRGRTMMWTEKYRAKKFTELVGDERTHRSVLWWLKKWDPIVFPGSARHKPMSAKMQAAAEERSHRKILMLTGPPGLGKTTLAHVCARQAGYEVLEINASDDRSRDVVRGRIRDSVGTENVKGVDVKTASGKERRAGRPVCVVVDEVDGVVGGSSGSGGEGGFVKALIDLVLLDQKNSNSLDQSSSSANGKKKKGDSFRLMRPLILICNDVYHPSLRPLRQSSLAEIIHVRKPPINMVIPRVKTIFEKEGFPCDSDAVRRLCEATWGLRSRREGGGPNDSGSGEGDLRGVLVVAEWIARKLKSTADPTLVEPMRLTKKWVERHVINDLSHGGGSARGLGRGGAREVVERVFLEGAGFPKPIDPGHPKEAKSAPGGKVGVAEVGKRYAMERLRDMIDASGEYDRVMTECFSGYPTHRFQDDTFLSKPNSAYDWLQFHDIMSSKVYTSQEWELNPYLSQSALAFHYLFASPLRDQSWADSSYERGARGGDDELVEPTPFTGLRADFEAYEAEKHNRSVLLSLQSALSLPLLRSFRSPESISSELLPYLMQLLTPDVKPVVVGGSGDQKSVASVRKQSEKDMVDRAVEVMGGVGVTFHRSRVETEQGGHGGFIYRMEPPIDALCSFETASSSLLTSVPTRYAVRQVLEQEYQKYLVRQNAAARQARYKRGGHDDDEELPSESKSKSTKHAKDKSAALLSEAIQNTKELKRDFFGRIINEARKHTGALAPGLKGIATDGEDEENASGTGAENRKKRRKSKHSGEDGSPAVAETQENKVWVSFHEGFSNAVRKPVTLADLLSEL
ncbi:hypothetical protein L228DRAFT_282212 [Xylona heveae TC161]|uniref:AAA+ ATPase domain-containing protein n=1 Tax=Xylona heveae (strain CBS 132557 / TC161) TaxID=1328760 RepID=A0A165HGQ7_XYLHT|nr:hypothetical protein L228DRAFT_282212 [Xylona heveae TC161]KZF23489.1 hypothetical protein L228DRAFT_282212 [Xylona heveae TC161]